jgi:hypothetical protein
MDPLKAWLEQVNTVSTRTIQEANALMAQWSTDEKTTYAMWVAAS